MNNQISVSIIIPCFNEQSTIEKAVKNVRENGINNKEIIIIDDHSNDGTIEKLENLPEESDQKIIFNTKNHGKGYCLRKGFKEAKGEIILIHDADLEYDTKDHAKVLEPIFKDYADVVYGSRFISEGPTRLIYFWHKIGNFFLTNLCNLFLNLSMTDMETCLKAFKKKDIEKINLFEDRFGIEPEITIKLAKQKLRFYEVAIKYYGRTYKEGKKIKWYDGLYAVIAIIKYSIFS